MLTILNPRKNRLLAEAASLDCQPLLPHFELVALDRSDVLYQSEGLMPFA